MNEPAPSAASPLSEADPRSLDELFNSKPPFDSVALRTLVNEMRRMREKWEKDEAEGKSKRNTKKAESSAKVVSGDLWGDEG